MSKKRITATQTNKTGRNIKYRDNYKDFDMSRMCFVRRIEKGEYSNYHVRMINNVKTPVSNPDSKKKNNLIEAHNNRTIIV